MRFGRKEVNTVAGHFNLGLRKAGDVIKVSLSGSASNVLLLDSLNFNNYRNGRRCQYYGGYYKQSPIFLKIPNLGHWHVAISSGGSVKASVQVLAH